MKKFSSRFGFTIVELMVVVSVIGILASIVYANFGSARGASRDDVRKSALKEVQLALELYKAQNGSYPLPDASCGANDPTKWYGPGPVSSSEFISCTNYIGGLAPDFIATLPIDPKGEMSPDAGFYYKTNGNDYKLIVHGSIEMKLIKNYDDDFARCPDQCTGTGCSCLSATPNSYIYAVYSANAKNW